MEYHGKFGHTIFRLQHLSIVNRLKIFYTSCRLGIKIVAPTLHGFQGIKRYMQYLSSHPHKPIFYPSNYYGGSNVIIITWSGTQIEYYTTQNCLECHQDADHEIILNRRRSVFGIIHTLLGVSVFCKVQIQPNIASYSTDVEIRYKYKGFKKTK